MNMSLRSYQVMSQGVAFTWLALDTINYNAAVKESSLQFLPFTKKMPVSNMSEKVEQGITWKDNMPCRNIHHQALTPSYCASVPCTLVQ